jgi:hypothetical protein
MHSHRFYESKTLDSRIQQKVTSFDFWFDRGDSKSNNEELDAWLQHGHAYITTKHVPNALALRYTGWPSLRRVTRDVLKTGVPIAFSTKEGEKIYQDQGAHARDDALSRISQTLTGSEEKKEHPQVNLDIPVEYQEVSDFIPEFAKGQKIISRDFFTAVAAKCYADDKSKDFHLYVWNSDNVRLSDKIKAKYLNRYLVKGQKPFKNATELHKVRSVEFLYSLLINNTFWGCRLKKHCAKGSPTRTWAKLLSKRIKHFLEGKGDPLWSAKKKERVYGRDREVQPVKQRWQRLEEVLTTINGMFSQRWLALPEEVWTYEKFDDFTLQALSMLLSDEFFDGKLEIDPTQVGTNYSDLKKVKKWLKRLTLAGQKPPINGDGDIVEDIPRWLLYLPIMYTHCAEIANEYSRCYSLDELCQTRGVSKPPHVCRLQAIIKNISTFTEQPEPLNPTVKGILKCAVRSVIQGIPDEYFTGLRTKAVISVTTNACWEKSRGEGGTLSALADIVALKDVQHPVQIYSLDTGRPTRTVHSDEMELGEYIFWKCMEIVLSTDVEKLARVFLLIVSEPGKPRGITKGMAALKVVLEVCAKIMSYPLTKVNSSTSGMSRSNHGWNFFRAMFGEELDDVVFPVKEKRTISRNGNKRRVRIEYEDTYVSSTDYETATDYYNHEVGLIVGEAWMTRCGLPRVLKGIVKKIELRPRWVYFTAMGSLSKYGEPTPFENVNRIRLVRGILMGSHTAKPFLHVTNMLPRNIAMNCANKEWYSGIFVNSEEMAKAARAYPSLT